MRATNWTTLLFGGVIMFGFNALLIWLFPSSESYLPTFHDLAWYWAGGVGFWITGNKINN